MKPRALLNIDTSPHFQSTRVSNQNTDQISDGFIDTILKLSSENVRKRLQFPLQHPHDLSLSPAVEIQ